MQRREYIDFEVCIGTGAEGAYPVRISSTLKAAGTFRLDRTTLGSQLSSIEKTVRRSGAQRTLSEPELADSSIEEFGRRLFDTLFEGALLEAFKESRRQAALEQKGLRIRLRIEAADLSVLPWEFLHDSSQGGDWVALSAGTPVVRYLEVDVLPKAVLTVDMPLRILAMFASPNDRPKLDTRLERLRMEDAFADLAKAGRLKIDFMEGASWRDLQDTLRGPDNYHIFHFVGHGGFDAETGEGVLAFVDEETGGTHPILASDLGTILEREPSLRLAVLNACEGARGSADDVFSSTAAMLVRKGVPAVVAMQYEISDVAAIEFSRTLYEDIVAGAPVDEAVASARLAIKMACQSMEWGTPVLYLRSSTGDLFDVTKPIIPPNATPVVPAPAPAPKPAPPPPPPVVPTTPMLRRRPVQLGLAAVAVAGAAVTAWLLFRRPDPILGVSLYQRPDATVVHGGTTAAVVAVDYGAEIQVAGAANAIAELTRRKARAFLRSSDPTVVPGVEADASGRFILAGARPGITTVWPVVIGQYGDSVVAKDAPISVTVMPSPADSTLGREAWHAADSLRTDPSVPDADLLLRYRAVDSLHGMVLDPSQLRATMSRVTALAATRARADSALRDPVLTVQEKTRRLQAYVDSAVAIRGRNYPTRAADADSLKALDPSSIGTIAPGEASICRPPSSSFCAFGVAPDTVFAAGGAAVATVRWKKGPSGSGAFAFEWLAPDGSSTTKSFSTANERRYDKHEGLTPGTWEFRVRNERGQLVYRQRFVVR
ncbi:MAG: CHAT domain-containing protein [Gemmatimonadales bacterium]